MDFDFSKIEGFEWDVGNLEHVKKHHVEAEECEQVFKNRPLLISPDVEHSKTETRFKVLGKSNVGRFIFLSFTIRNKKIRVVSARDQNRIERQDIAKIGGEDILKN